MTLRTRWEPLHSSQNTLRNALETLHNAPETMHKPGKTSDFRIDGLATVALDL